MSSHRRLPLLPTTVVGSYPQPHWLVDHDKLIGRGVPPRVRMREVWRIPEPYLEEAQDDATIVAIRDLERAGIDVNQPVPIDKLAASFEQMRSGDERNRDERNRDERNRDQRNNTTSTTPPVPTGPQGFGTTAAVTAGVPGFDTPLMSGISAVPIEKRFDAEVIEYVKRKYGEESVAQIITFGTMKSKAAVRDVARVLQLPLAEADRLAKLIPNAPGSPQPVRVEEAIEQVPEIGEAYRSSDRLRRLLDDARALQGLARHASVHAAGVVIAPDRLVNYVPLYRSERSELTTQWDMASIERVGLLKIDFLGLKTLTIIDDAIDMIAEKTGERIDVDALPLDDAEPYRLLGRGETEGIFQFESSLATDICKRTHPARFEDLIALNALIRPGPLDCGMTERYISRKRGEERIDTYHEDLTDLLAETSGVITYQEQVMQIANRVAGFSLAEADILRKARALLAKLPVPAK